MTRSTPREIVVIGASAGGVEALTKLVPFLPPGSPAAYFLVVHVGQSGTSSLPAVLGAKAAMPVAYAVDGDAIEAGTLTVAPAGVHTVLTPGSVRLVAGPRENGHRPAVDTLFRSAASAFDGAVTGVVLSGSLDDGAAGLAAIANAGGRTLVQDPDEALYASMPLNAIARTVVDAVLPIEGIARVLRERPRTEGRSRDRTLREVRMSERNIERGGSAGESSGGADEADRLDRIGIQTELTCPGCGGAIWEVETDGVPVLRCHVGHAYGLDSFGFEQSLAVESALWTAVRALEEKEILLTRLGEQAKQDGRARSAESFLGRAEGLQRQAEAIRRLVESVMAAESESAGAEGGVPA